MVFFFFQRQNVFFLKKREEVIIKVYKREDLFKKSDENRVFKRNNQKGVETSIKGKEKTDNKIPDKEMSLRKDKRTHTQTHITTCFVFLLKVMANVFNRI